MPERIDITPPFFLFLRLNFFVFASDNDCVNANSHTEYSYLTLRGAENRSYCFAKRLENFYHDVTSMFFVFEALFCSVNHDMDKFFGLSRLCLENVDIYLPLVKVNLSML